MKVKTQTSIFKATIFFILAALVPASLLLFLTPVIDVPYTSDVYQLTNVWQENGEPFTGRTFEEGEEVKLTWTICDDPSIRFPALQFFSNYCATDVYVDESLVFSYRSEEDAWYNIVPNASLYVELPENCSGKQISVYLYPSVETYFSCDSFYYGNIEDVRSFYLQSRRLPMLAGVFLIVFGFLLTVTIFFIRPIYRRYKNILFHGPLLMDLGIYFMCYNQIFFFIVPNNDVDCYMEHMSLYLVPLLLQCTVTIYEEKKDVLGYVLIAIDATFAALSLALSLAGYIYIKDVLWIGHGLVFVQGLILICRFFATKKELQTTEVDYYLYNGKIGSFTVLSGAMVMIVCAFVEMLVWYFPYVFGIEINIVVRGGFLMIGAIVLAATMVASYFFYTIANINEENIQKDLEGIAYNDELTDIGNRTNCEQTMEVLSRQKTRCTVISMDLDGLKELNDTVGHGAGDRMLISFANLLKEQFGNCPLIGRMGGDEFLVILDGENQRSCDAMLQSFQNRIDAFNTTCDEFQLSVSWGYAFASEALNHKVQQAYLDADAKMYAMKRQKKRGGDQ